MHDDRWKNPERWNAEHRSNRTLRYLQHPKFFWFYCGSDEGAIVWLCWQESSPYCERFSEHFRASWPPMAWVYLPFFTLFPSLLTATRGVLCSRHFYPAHDVLTESQSTIPHRNAIRFWLCYSIYLASVLLIWPGTEGTFSTHSLTLLRRHLSCQLKLSAAVLVCSTR